ncbi:MAG: primosomal protein N' [Wenzhouxiangella sp.]
MIATVEVAVPVPLPQRFDYLPPSRGQQPTIGSRVLVPFGRRRMVGLVVGHGQAVSAEGLKPIEQVLDCGLIEPGLMQLALWTVRYYGCPPGELVNLLLPPALRRLKPFRTGPPARLALTEAGRSATVSGAPRQAQVLAWLAEQPLARDDLLARGISGGVLKALADKGWVEPAERGTPLAAQPGPQLNPEQRAALAVILRARRRHETLLLAGVTGSGKTEVYLRAASAMLQRGRQVLMLIPEIGLTPQLIRRVEARLGITALVYHSGLSEGERLACWRSAASGQARVIVGTRSAVFLPLARPGLIVVDEEHDGSFKQQDGARYHGRDVAVMRAHLLDIPVVLGSATPSLESLANARSGRYRLLRIDRRAGSARPPRWSIADLRGQRGTLGSGLLATMQRHLDDGGQVLLYRNRRGYAPVLICPACGWQADCRRCSAHLTLHQAARRLQCHHCGASERLPARCPDCGEPGLQGLGAGTERLEDELRQHFPGTPVLRVDRDSMARRDQFARLLDQVRQGDPCILVGTQMLAKGHHFPALTLAAVLDADQALFSADFRAPERLGQAVCQVAGRAGRGDKPGQFILQSRQPEHPLLELLCRTDYLAFAGRLLDERAAAGLPPAAALALLKAEAQQPERARAFLARAAERLKDRGIAVQGPIPAILARRAGYWRFQLWLQAPARAGLLRELPAWIAGLYALPEARRVRWHLDMDPLEL